MNLEGNNEQLLFYGLYGFMVLSSVWTFYLDFRQRRILHKNVNPTPEVSLIMKEENFSKSRFYGLDTKSFELCLMVFQVVEMTVILFYNLMPKLWIFTISLLEYDRFPTESEELKASMVFLLFSFFYSLIINLPWKIYKTFVIEAKHNFNKETPLFFIKDQIKKALLSIALMLPISYALLFIIKRGGSLFYVYAWIFTFVILIIFMFVYPEFIAPLFDKYTLLPDGELKSRINELALKVQFPLTKIYVVEGSKRSSHSNAYFYGFWKNKRIVLFDTLLADFHSKAETDSGDENMSDNKDDKSSKGCTNDEILAVLGHEFGHWKENHTLQFMVISQLNVLLNFFMFGLLFNMQALFNAFGFVDMETPTVIRLLLILQYLFAPYSFVLQFLMTLLSRRNEFRADYFAAKLGMNVQLISALVKLQNDNLSFPLNDWLYSLFNHSHPPVVERIKALNEEPGAKMKQL